MDTYKISNTSLQLILSILFFLSGCSALIYQVMWQRMLFTSLGVDLASITIIVSVFMFGLGIGGLMGGYTADKMPAKLLLLYVVIEFAIAGFGFASPLLIENISHLASGHSEFITAITSFLLLAFPTILMGATFPILVTHINQFNQHIGRSVGTLYFANTLGGASGAYFAGFILLYSFDVPHAINQAAFLNLAIAVSALLLFRKPE